MSWRCSEGEASLSLSLSWIPAGISPMQHPPRTERELIARLAELFGTPPPEVAVGISDDCAAIDLGGEDYLLVTADALVEGVHFDLAYTPLFQLGWKSLAVNLSDIAAMGGEPRYALLTLGWPPARELAGALELGAGLAACAREYGVEVIGGDTVASPGGLSLSLTVTGKVPKSQLLLRRGARVGDLVYVTGPLGEAAAGLLLLSRGLSLPPSLSEPLIQAHLTPHPQLTAGRLLAREGLATALIDLSDGVATDLMHLCTRSGVGARLRAAELPISPGVRRVAALTGKEPWELALTGGEDYHLLFTCPPDRAPELPALFSRAGLSPPWRLGEIVPGSDVVVIIDKKEKLLSWGGFEHFRLDSQNSG